MLPPLTQLSAGFKGKLRSLFFILSLASLSTLNIHLAFAEETETESEQKTFWTQDTMTGDWGGHRSHLSEKGVDFEFTYTADVMANVAGGVQKQADYLDNIDLILSIDAEKLAHWKGASFYFYGIGTQGGSPSANSGDLQGPSNIESPDFWRLHEAWYQQKLFNEKFSFLLGLYDLNSEFDSMETASLFMNSSHGIGIDYAQSGVNGPSIYPYTSLTARLKLEPTPWLYVQTALYDGVPGDPAHPHSTQIKFQSGDGLLVSSEIGFLPGGLSEDHPYGKFALGSWIYSESFDDIVDVDTAGDPVKRSGNFGFYLLGEYNVYREADHKDQGLNVFARFGYANPNINQINYYMGLGAVYTGLIPSRDSDKLGLAFANALNGSHFLDAMDTAGTSMERMETNMELTYNAQVFPWFSLQPDFQYIINPGTDPALNNAFQMGLRFSFTL